MDAVDVLAASYRLRGLTRRRMGLALLEHVGLVVVFSEAPSKNEVTIKEIHSNPPPQQILDHRFARQGSGFLFHLNEKSQVKTLRSFVVGLVLK